MVWGTVPAALSSGHCGVGDWNWPPAVSSPLGKLMELKMKIQGSHLFLVLESSTRNLQTLIIK